MTAGYGCGDVRQPRAQSSVRRELLCVRPQKMSLVGVPPGVVAMDRSVATRLQSASRDIAIVGLDGEARATSGEGSMFIVLILQLDDRRLARQVL